MEIEDSYSKLYKENSITFGGSMNNFLDGVNNSKRSFKIQ